MDLYIFGGKILTPFRVIEDGTIRTAQSRTLKIGPTRERPRPSAEAIDAQNLVILKDNGFLKRRLFWRSVVITGPKEGRQLWLFV